MGEPSGDVAEPTGDPVVDAALADLARTDQDRADAAVAGFASLTWGEGLGAVTAHGLADFLWYQLPTKWMCDLDEKLLIAAGLADLFERVGRPRYAAMCASGRTAEILAAYEKDEHAGLRAYRSALVATGTEPPDIPGVLVWGLRLGVDEAAAYWSVSVALERAIEQGRLHPGRSGWRQAARRITGALLDSARDDLTGVTWLQWVQTERLQRWSEDHGAEHERRAKTVVNRLIHPAPVPESAAQHLAALRWLLEHAADGAPLTETGNLSRALVVEACRTFEWFPRNPRTENHVYELTVLRRLVARMGVVRRTRRKLVLTAAGKAALAGSVDSLWQLTMENLLGADPADAAAGEAALMLLIDGAAYGYTEMNSAVAEILIEQGWHDQDTGALVAHDAAGHLLSGLRGRIEVLKLAVEPKFGGPLQLSPAGRAAAQAALRARALRPRTNSFS